MCIFLSRFIDCLIGGIVTGIKSVEARACVNTEDNAAYANSVEARVCVNTGECAADARSVEAQAFVNT